MFEQIIKALGVKPEMIQTAMTALSKGQDDIEIIKILLQDILETNKKILIALNKRGVK